MLSLIKVTPEQVKDRRHIWKKFPERNASKHKKIAPAKGQKHYTSQELYPSRPSVYLI